MENVISSVIELFPAMEVVNGNKMENALPVILPSRE